MLEKVALQEELDRLAQRLPGEAKALREANFPEKPLLIVGGTGSIGSAAVQVAHEFGARSTVLTYNKKKEEAEELALETGAVALRYTTGTHKAAKKLVAKLPEGIGYVLDASGLLGNGSAAKTWADPKLVRQMFNTNAIGPYFLFLALLNSQKLNLGAQLAYTSTVAVDGNRDQSLYAASKASMGAAAESFMMEDAIIRQGWGVKSLELAIVDTGAREVKVVLFGIRQADKKSPGIMDKLKEEGYLVTPVEAAYRLLAAMASPENVGRVRIPPGASVSAISGIIFPGNSKGS
ncbi:SDR family NAD(P)-dependent oxidoreductase [Candidatus Woesearchaeota archaeon]|nr:SDR family NAD(P)-dependent oxidoreductase [Candidatus Woesearchaeota archaeon]